MATRTANTGSVTWNTNAAWVGGVQPTAADDVVIPASSVMTVPTATTVLGRSLTVQASATLIFATTTSIIALGDATAGAGNVALSISSTATVTLTGVGTIQFLSTNATVQTITTGGKTLPNLTFGGVGGSWIFQDNLSGSVSATLSLTAGTLDTNSKTISIGNLAGSGASAKTLTLGASVIMLTGTNTPMNLAGTNQILNAGTSIVYVTPISNAGNFGFFAGLVWNDVVMQNVGLAICTSLACNNFTRTGTAVKTDGLNVVGNIICTGTFTCTGNSVTNRMNMVTSTPGVQYVVLATTHNITNTDMMDIIFETNAAGSVITSDSFNRADGSLGGSTTDAAAGGAGLVWSSPSGGTWNISSNQVQTTLPTSYSSITVNVGVRNVIVEAKIGSLGASGNSLWMLAAGWVDANNFAYCRVNQSGTITVGYLQAGSGSTLLTITSVTAAVGDTMSLELIGQALLVRRNGTVVGATNMTAAISDTLQGTRAGLAGTNNITTISQFDDFKATNVTPAINFTGCGDGQGNVNASFPASVDRYAVAPGNWSSTAMWSASSGGSAGASVPLPQDNVFLNASSAAGTYTVDMPRLGASIDMTGFTRTFSVALSTSMYGSLTLSTGMTYTVASNFGWNFRGRGTHTITSAGKDWKDGGIGSVIAAPGGSYSMLDDWGVNSSAQSFFLSVTQGTFNTNNFNLAVSAFQSTGSSTRVINFGTSTITCTYTSFWTVSGSAFTVNATASTIICAPLGTAATRVFAGGSVKYNILRYTSTGVTYQLTISGNNYFDTLEIGSGRPLSLATGSQNTVRNWIATGTNFGYQVFTAGQNATTIGVYVADSAALRVSGDITIVSKLTMPNWVPGSTQAIVAKNNVAVTAGYILRFAATGALQLYIGNVSVTSTASTSTVFSAGATGWVRASWSDSANTVTFYTSNDGTSWTQLGTTVALSSVGIPTSTDTLYIGQRNTNDVLTGNMYRLIIYSDTSLTTKVLDVDFTTKPFGANSFTEGSSNAATVTIAGTQIQAGDGRVLVASATAGTQAYLELIGSINSLDYQTVQDIYASIPFKYYAGANSINISNNTGVTFAAPLAVQPYISKQADASNTVNTLTVTLPFGMSATAGNLLIIAYTSIASPGTVTTPTGFTLIDTISYTGGAGTAVTFSKIAAGGETSVQVVTSAIAVCSIKFFEIEGIEGTPLVDVKDKNANSVASNTSLSTGSGVTNTVSPALAVAFWGMNGTMGASVSFTNNYVEARWATQLTTLHAAVALLTSLGSNSSTHTWTTSRAGSAQLIVVGGLSISGNHNLPMLGVGS